MISKKDYRSSWKGLSYVIVFLYLVAGFTISLLVSEKLGFTIIIIPFVILIAVGLSIFSWLMIRLGLKSVVDIVKYHKQRKK